MNGLRPHTRHYLLSSGVLVVKESEDTSFMVYIDSSAQHELSRVCPTLHDAAFLL